MHGARLWFALAGLGPLFGASVSVPRLVAADQAIPVSFSRDIRPILSANCFQCHGPDERTRKAGLRLDKREAAAGLRDGGAAVVPGRPEESQLVARIFAVDPADLMPPPSSNKALSEAQKEMLKSWVAQGALYEAHWAFVRPQRPQIPAVSDAAWPRNPIDPFVLARLEATGLHPSPPAEPHELVRRLYLDLIGLPPAPEEADQFVRDPSEEAYGRLVDRLLASEHYGERWARPWLDLARYADSNGYEKDRTRSIWPYRDWVIRALNRDMPFDEFTMAQLAGDLLPEATLEDLIATGFHRNTMLNEEGGIDPLEYRFHAMTDRVATTGTAWLGLTLGCAQCHTHKYDPITQHEYYQIMAFLNNADEPEIDLPDPAAERRYQENLLEAARLLQELPDHWPLDSQAWQIPAMTQVRTESGQEPERLEDDSWLLPADGPEGDVYTAILEVRDHPVDRLKLEALTHASLPAQGPGRVAHGNFVLNEVRIEAAPLQGDGSVQTVRMVGAQADVEQDGFPAAHAIDDNPATGWAVHRDGQPLNRDHHLTLSFAEPIGFPGGTRLTVRLVQRYGRHHTIGRLRLSVPKPADPNRDALPMAQRRGQAVEQALAAWLTKERARTVPWTSLRPVKTRSNLPLLTVQEDDSVLVSGDTTKADTYELEFHPGPHPITALRLEALPDSSLPAHGPGLTYYEGEKGDFFLGEFQLSVDGRPVLFRNATESYGKNRFGASPVSAALTIDGDPQTGWSVSGRTGERHVAVFVPEPPIREAGELKLTMLFGRHFASSLGRFRISVTDVPDPPPARDLPADVETVLLLPEAQWSAAQRDRLRESFLLQAPQVAEQARRIQELRRPPDLVTTLVMRERPPANPRPTFLHHRGEFLQPTDPVTPGLPEALAGLPAGTPRNRLGFARWLVSRENPLTARVTVNRQWAAFFGQGLVRTLEDFGAQGELPSHPDLLDWLAMEFVDQGWSLKKIHRLIVMSATYRQSSRLSPALLEADPENRLLSRAPRLRLEGEILRDQLLGASGLLSEKQFGPPVRPPQPEGVTEVAYGNPKWEVSAGQDRYRRSIYTFQKRTAPFAMFTTFDAPSGEKCVARRDRSNGPLQALTLLNDVMLVEAAQAFGQRLAAMEGDDSIRIQSAFRRVLVRPARDEEMSLLTRFVAAQRERFASGALDPKPVAGEGAGPAAERAVWTSLARALFNLDETVTRN